ncbi:MAG: hypothetical protein M3Q07_18810 [Pseudobdellovibrionaceae bacterium]|nr:hypothetical protein [Pseudobdellovibrionaceae bacterium]
MSQKTLYRYSIGETKPSVDVAVSIGEIICRDKFELADVIRPLSKNIADYILASVPHTERNQTSSDVVYRDEILKDPLLFSIYRLTLKIGGTTRDEIKEAFGAAGLSKLDRLFEMEILTEGAEIIRINAFPYFLNDSHNRRAIELINSSHGSNPSDNPTAIRYWADEGLDAKSIMELTTEIRALEQKIRSYMNDPLRAGPHNWSCTITAEAMRATFKNKEFL